VLYEYDSRLTQGRNEELKNELKNDAFSNFQIMFKTTKICALTHQVGWRHLSIPRPQKPAAGQKIGETLRLLDYAAHQRPNINSAHQWSDNWPQNSPKAVAIAGVLGDCYWSNFSTAQGGFLRCYWLNSDQHEGRNSGALDEGFPAVFRRPDSAAVAVPDQGPAS
jgi:hypothetical protein